MNILSLDMDTVTAVPKLRAPIVLVHGLLGFDAIRIQNLELISYFRGIRPYLARAGNRVQTARLSPTSRVPERAKQLRRFIDRVSPDEPVHLFAHSLGGLDSRYMIAKLDAGDRVLTLTTLGTPHRGTPYADWGVRWFGMLLERQVQMLPALLDLTTAACQQFNEEVKDDPRVRYFSVAARPANRWSPEWMISEPIVREQEGENDGLVSVASARYGTVLDPWHGDHYSLINRASAHAVATLSWRDQRHRYGLLVKNLKEMGY